MILEREKSKEDLAFFRNEDQKEIVELTEQNKKEILKMLDF